MAAEFIDKAVTEMAAALGTETGPSAALAAALRTVESEVLPTALTSGSLTDPVAVERHRAENDNRSPYIQVFDSPGIEVFDDAAGGHWWPVTVRLTFIGQPLLEDNEDFVRRYLTAIIRTIRDDSTTGVTSEIESYAPQTPVGDQADSRHVWEINYRYFICST